MPPGAAAGPRCPARLLLRLEPDAIARLATRLDGGSIVISATNGKTTTAAMVSAILERTGTRLVHNRAGANMAGGVASALLDAAERGGHIAGDTGLFEVDEFWLAIVVDALHPRALVLGNLFRDQLDRYGELDAIADRWAEVVASQPPETKLVLNADDPLVADLGGAPRMTGPASPRRPTSASTTTRSPCPSSSTPPTPSTAAAVAMPTSTTPPTSPTSATTTVPTAAGGVPIPRSSRATCASRACARRAFVSARPAATRRSRSPSRASTTSTTRWAPPRWAARSACRWRTSWPVWRACPRAFGRAETIRVGDRDLVLLLVKNPAGANEVLRTLVLEDGQLDVLGLLNDRIADGRDVSWVWDADFEILAPRVARMTCGGSAPASWLCG